MFYQSKLTSLDVSQWNTSNVTDMLFMFVQSKLTSLDVSQWNTSNVTDMSLMFIQSKLTSLDVSQWNTSNVTDMEQMFAFSELTSLDLTNWDTSKVQNSYRMFFYTGIKKLTLGSKTKFNDSPELPHIDQSSGVYTGRWERIDPVSPQSFYNGSYDFMSKYDGSFPGTYVWEKTKVKAADVTAKYLDENGNTISDDVVKNGNVGDSYTTEQKAIPGYTFKAVQGNPTGQFTSDAQTVTYIYTKDPVAGGNVTVKYVDGAGGNTISDNVVKSGNIGDDYSTDQKAIPGYTFKEVQGSASGQFTDKEQTITYVYTKNSVTPVKPTEPGTTQTNENNTETPVKNTTNVSLHNNVSTLGSVSTTNEKSLPTTGEKPANWSVVVGGLITLTAATVLYLLKRKY
ncbi:Internalin-J (plasmid) [Streptococcus parauberis]|jgi:LPXTG-motif cell wall-anchored protein|nr:Internalin-J [Streptococcus parauberis]